MNQLGFVANKQFWAGVAATITVSVLVSMGIPNLLRARFSSEEFSDSRSVDTAVLEGRGAVNISAALAPAGDADDRKIVRTGSMDIIVRNPKDVSEKIAAVAQQLGGFLVSSEISGGDNSASASLVIRVPADKFEVVRRQIASLGVRIQSEKVQAEDVTKQYVDQAARLRNLRAQETQYLAILKQAKTVKDTVDVSDKLNEVRSQIEQQQAELDLLSKQVETVALTLSLRAEADTQVFGLHWRPLYQLKLAARQGLEGVGDYIAVMASFLFYIPAILLWIVTTLIGIAVAWRIVRWARRTLFVQKIA